MGSLKSKNVGEILIVDDDPSGLKFFSLSLQKGEYRVATALSAGLAKEMIKQRGIKHFDCVLTDYRMPGENGIELLNWLRDEDPCLATIIVTAEGEMNLVRDSMRGGAVDFLEKPVNRKTLEAAIAKGIEHTKKRRSLEDNDKGVRAVSELNQIFEAVRAPEIESQLAYFSNPHHEIGGDFINVLPVGQSRYAFILGDVSGHDVRAAFVSAYFQGMVRGLLEKNSSVEEIVPLFNILLNQEWSTLTGTRGSRVPIMTSLAVCAAMLDTEEKTLTMLNCGIPQPIIVHKSGRITRPAESNPPLGWFSYWDFKRESYSTEDLAFLYICTDGIQECADALSIDPLSLIFKLLENSQQDGKLYLEDSNDDILLMRFCMSEADILQDLPQPIIYEQYSGQETESIDKFQNVWRRSLKFVLPGELEDRVYDILLCCREGVLNALNHGCDGAGEKLCSLSVSYCKNQGLLRVRIDDPGHGHDFDVDKRVEQIDEFRGEQLGLTLITKLSDVCVLENQGSTIVFDFKVEAASS